MAAPILEVLDLHKRYGSTIALDGARFQVEAGEMFGLLGPNGAGKTTLLSIMSGLLDATSGEVRILGRRVQSSDLELRRAIGIVPQELALYAELTAAENLYFFGELYGMRGQHLRQRAREVLEAMGLGDRTNQRVDTFSGGMKRRLNLGVALMHQPPLLLLDEPTTGVDPQSRNHIFEEVRRLNASGVTVVYTSHYMEEVQALCTRIGIMDEGRLRACDTLPALLRRMHGRLRFRVRGATGRLREQLGNLPDTKLLGAAATDVEGALLELVCVDLKATLLELPLLIRQMQLEVTDLHIEEPSLEGVFLQLTGRALRD